MITPAGRSRSMVVLTLAAVTMFSTACASSDSSPPARSGSAGRPTTRPTVSRGARTSGRSSPDAGASTLPAGSPSRSAASVWRRYAWAEDDNAVSNAATFTLVKGLTPRQALDVVAPRRGTRVESVARAEQWASRQAYEPSGSNALIVAAGTRDGWTMLLEDNGFEATLTANRLSRRGIAVVIYNNVDALASFEYARNGRLLRSFDPLTYSSAGPGRPLRQERGIGFGRAPYPYIAQSLLLAERLTGFATRPSDLHFDGYPIAVGVWV